MPSLGGQKVSRKKAENLNASRTRGLSSYRTCEKGGLVAVEEEDRTNILNE